MKTNRGFEIQHFKDDYDLNCSIQESSAIEPHVWLGADSPKVWVMTDQIEEIAIQKENPDPNYGWCVVQLPERSFVDCRMHLNRKQAKLLAKKLLYFSRHGYLKEK